MYNYRGHHSEGEVSLLMVNDSPSWNNRRQRNICKTEKQEFLLIAKHWHKKKKQKSLVLNARWICSVNQIEGFFSRVSSKKPDGFVFLQCWKIYCEHHTCKNRFSEYDRVIISTCHITYLATCEYKLEIDSDTEIFLQRLPKFLVTVATTFLLSKLEKYFFSWKVLKYPLLRYSAPKWFSTALSFMKHHLSKHAFRKYNRDICEESRRDFLC